MFIENVHVNKHLINHNQCKSFISRLFNRRSFSKFGKNDISLPNPLKLSFSQLSPPNGPNDLKNPVLVYHGLFGSKNNWRYLSRTISERTGRKVFAFDLRNHGESPHSDELTNLGMASDLKYFMDQESIDKSVLVGHSLGGKAVIQFALLFVSII